MSIRSLDSIGETREAGLMAGGSNFQSREFWTTEIEREGWRNTAELETLRSAVEFRSFAGENQRSHRREIGFNGRIIPIRDEIRIQGWLRERTEGGRFTGRNQLWLTVVRIKEAFRHMEIEEHIYYDSEDDEELVTECELISMKSGDGVGKREREGESKGRNGSQHRPRN
ncbi:hypothetical protein DFH06DRAFT_63392 [Mycena polygramma]|nr:hypothetical protein DFH06DRAFT_63392 [Mycena polygramma]